METLGNRIKQAREAAGLSQKDLGALVGVFGSVIGRYEIDNGEPKASMIVKLAKALNVPTDYLLGFEVDRIQALITAVTKAGFKCRRINDKVVITENRIGYSITLQLSEFEEIVGSKYDTIAAEAEANRKKYFDSEFSNYLLGIVRDETTKSIIAQIQSQLDNNTRLDNKQREALQLAIKAVEDI